MTGFNEIDLFAGETHLCAAVGSNYRNRDRMLNRDLQPRAVFLKKKKDYNYHRIAFGYLYPQSLDINDRKRCAARENESDGSESGRREGQDRARARAGFREEGVEILSTALA